MAFGPANLSDSEVCRYTSRLLVGYEGREFVVAFAVAAPNCSIRACSNSLGVAWLLTLPNAGLPIMRVRDREGHDRAPDPVPVQVMQPQVGQAGVFSRTGCGPRRGPGGGDIVPAPFPGPPRAGP